MVLTLINVTGEGEIIDTGISRDTPCESEDSNVEDLSVEVFRHPVDSYERIYGNLSGQNLADYMRNFCAVPK